MSYWTRRGFLAAGLALAGCTAPQRPPLGPIYRATRGNLDQPPLVVIPGAFGSSLRDRRSGREIWPGTNRHLLVSNYRDLELEIDPATLEPIAGDVEAYDVFREGLGRDFYGKVLDMLEDAGGYTHARPGGAPRAGQRNYYVYLYDWRLDNVAAARGLHELIEAIRSDYGDPRMQVDVLAHSNGGLLARYYARYGTADLPSDGEFEPTQAGAPAIRRLLIVGTPNLGTMQPVLANLRGEEIGLRRIPQEVVATCTGAPQMMPHPAIPWIVDREGRDLPLPLFDIATWQESGWSIFDPRVAERAIGQHGGGRAGREYLELLRAYMAKHLLRGRRFMESLAVPGGPGELHPYVFGGDCELTLARVVGERVDGRLLARERVEDISSPRGGVDYQSLMFEPGDTVVTRSSLLGRRTLNVAAPRTEFESIEVANSVFLCEEHQALTGNATFQNNLLNTLLSVDVG
jgi:pimeloyl-ACP methyl ester carboxylesterase